jgi:hypothetical protein
MHNQQVLVYDCETYGSATIRFRLDIGLVSMKKTGPRLYSLITEVTKR